MQKQIQIKHSFLSMYKKIIIIIIITYRFGPIASIHYHNIMLDLDIL